jgi:GDP-L-fucose synthase
MPTNLYGPNDKFEEFNSHVIPGLIFKMHRAKINKSKEVEIWGSGKPLREFMHVDDLSSAIEFLIRNEISNDILNVGSNEVVSIKELSKLIQKVIGFKGNLVFNQEYPDGNPKKLLDSTQINNLGWKSSISLEDGISNTYSWYVDNLS